MKKENLKLNPNPLVQYLEKLPREFTKSDIIDFVIAHEIEMINFRYCGADGRLKTLNLIINDLEYLDTILTCGERVDGSSLFSHLDTSSSDLYVVPRFRTAFVNPFADIPTLDILCSYYTKDGYPLESAPEYTLVKAHKELQRVTGCQLEVMGELEYYVITPNEDIFETPNQRGYHESSPFNKSEDFRAESMQMIAQCGGLVKYGHSEVGNFVEGNNMFEQNEVEFLPTTIEEAAEQLLIAKWIIRKLAYEYGFEITFAPKISVGKAGSGMHVHTRLMKDGKNAYTKDGKLTDEAYKAIAGMLALAPSISAFGNRNPTSYFRLVPHQEAPTNICWGDMNRSALVRVPLGWNVKRNMSDCANGFEQSPMEDYSLKQTIEFRCPDGSADIYLLLSSLAVAIRHGFEMDSAVEYAKERYIKYNLFEDEHKELAVKLSQLPVSCNESANELDGQREIYQKYDVFPPEMIESTIEMLASFNDSKLREKLGTSGKMLEYVKRFINCG